MSALKLTDVGNRFIRHINFEVEAGRLFAIVGPSGAGKTSLLRVIAGLAAHDGEIHLDGQRLDRLPPHQRGLGYVSQELHLFPHLTADENLFIGMDRLGKPKTWKRERVRELLGLLRVEHLAGRKPYTFSGGEKQRVALARVLASSPRVLLLDEPFSKLDFRTGRYLREEFKNLQTSLGLTTILVTHNIDEARELGDALAVMRGGALKESTGKARMFDPNNGDGDFFLETTNYLACSPVRKSGEGLMEVDWSGFRFMVPWEGREFSCVAVGCRDIEIARESPAGPMVNRFQALIREVEAVDDSVRVVLDVRGERLEAEFSHEKWRTLCVSEGDEVQGYLSLRALRGC